MKPTNKNIRVAVAEDEFLVCREITRLLEDAGFIVAGTAANGKKAVEIVRSLKPDVVIMDIKMPELDGLQAAAQIQETSPTPVVVLTAYESHDLLERASLAGVGAYLVKPPNSAGIERAVAIAMARHNDLLRLRRMNEELEKAIAEIKTLRGIVPICSNCKKIRDKNGCWEQLEVYIRDRTEADFTHSLCPGCLKELYPGQTFDTEPHLKE